MSIQVTPVRAVVRENSIWALITRIPDACMWSYARKVVTDDYAKGANAFCAALPATTHVVQWGDAHGLLPLHRKRRILTPDEADHRP